MRIVAFVVFLIVNASLSFSIPKYKINASLDPINKTIHGSVEITFTNTSNISLSEIKILDYPTSWKEESKHLTEVNFDRIYPKKFNPGFMEISNKTLNYETSYNASLTLEQPFMPQEEKTITLEFKVQIPEKFGTFGYYRDTFTLVSLWHPALCALSESGWHCETSPEESDYTVEISVPKNFTSLIGDTIQTDKNVSFIGVRNFVPLIITKKIHLHTYEKLGYKVSYYSFDTTTKKAHALFERLDPILVFAYTNNLPRKPITIIESPIRDMLTFSTPDFLLSSDRIFEVFWFFKDFHEFYLAQGIFEYLIYDEVLKRENSDNERWVLESIAWYYFRAYQKATGKPIYAGDVWVVKLFWFIPAVQEALYAPQFAFDYAYLDNWHHRNPFPTIFTFNNTLREGKIVTERLSDYFSNDFFHDFFRSYLNQDNDYIGFLNSKTKSDMNTLVHNFRKKYRNNYFIKDVQKNETKSGYETTLTFGKEFTGDEISEPVTIALKERWGKQFYFDWHEGGSEKVITLITGKPLSLIEIDPFGRLIETKKSDNRMPEELQVFINYIAFSIDVFDKDIDAALALQIRRKYNYTNRVDFFPFYNPTGYGGSIGIGRQFGDLVDALRISHFARIAWFVENLNTAFISLENTNQETVEFPRDSGFISSIIFGYSLSNILSYKNPQSGTYLAAFLELSHKYTASDFDYYKTQASYIKLFRLANEHTLAVRSEFGFSGDDDVPEQKQFSLGGIFNLRGISIGKSEYTGKNKFLGGLEYRHPLFMNINLNADNWFRITKLKGALFTDTGRVTETVAEEHAALLDPSLQLQNDIVGVFDARQFSIGAGYSFQIYFDLAGIRETLLRMDIAKQLDNFDDESVKVYLSIDQPF